MTAAELPARPLSVDQAAEFLGCSPAHIRNLCARGELRHFRLGRLIRIPADAVRELVEAAAFAEPTVAPDPAKAAVLRIVKSPWR